MIRHSSTKVVLISTCAALAHCSSPPPDPPAPTIAVDVVGVEAPGTGLAGALAYMEFVDGTNELETADSNGHVVFTGKGVASGVKSVTAATDASRQIFSIVEPDTSSAVKIALWLVKPPTFTLSGSVAPKNVGDGILMKTTLGGVSLGTAYSMSVQPGGIFTIYGSESNGAGSAFARGESLSLVQFFHLDHPTLTANTTYDFDINKLTVDPTVTVSGEVVIPGGDTGPMGGASSILVHVLGDAVAQGATSPLPDIGLATAMGISADKNAFTYSLTYSPYADVTPYTYAQISQTDGSMSACAIAGFPTDNQTISNLALPLVIPDTLQEGTPIDATATAGTVALVVSDGPGLLYYSPSLRWVVSIPSGKISSVPGLPDAIKNILPTTPLRAALNTGGFPPAGGFPYPSGPGNATWSHSVRITP